MRPFDIQVNGYAGADFSAADVSLDACRTACAALAADGVDAILATLITGPIESLCGGLRRLASYRDAEPSIRRMIAGFHLEGPFISPQPGYAGAHATRWIRPADPDDMQRLLEAGDGLVRLVTLAPEQDPSCRTIDLLVRSGVAVSAGHTDATLPQLRRAIDAGLSMVTHLGNGCPLVLERHDNIIQRVLAESRRLRICFIPDGIHVPFFALRNYLDLVGPERCIMVSDAISAARLGPGRHLLGGEPVDVDEHGAARRPGAANLAGSTLTMPTLLQNLSEHMRLDAAAITRLVDTNPRAAVKLDTSIA